MASAGLSKEGDSINEKQSQEGSTDPSQSSSMAPEAPKQPPAPPQGVAQPAVLDGMEDIERLPDPAPPREPPPNPVVPTSPSYYDEDTPTAPVDCAAQARAEGCRFSMFIAAVIAFLSLFLVSFINPKLVEVYFFAASLVFCSIFKYKKKRGQWSKEPPFQFEDSKRNPYKDVPSPTLDEGNPLEPPCPRPQEEPPKELVYQAVIHHAPTSPSSPSTSSAAKGVDSAGGSDPQSPTPSTSAGVSCAEIPAGSQETEC